MKESGKEAAFVLSDTSNWDVLIGTNEMAEWCAIIRRLRLDDQQHAMDH